MNILFLIGSLKFSGAENVLRALTPRMNQNDNKVFIAIRTETDEKNYKGVPIYSFTGRSKERIAQLKQLIKKEKIDVVIGFGFPFTLDCAILKLQTKCKIIMCERHDPSSIKRTRIQRILKKVLYPLADLYIVQTKKTKEYYLNTFTKKSQKVIVIPNPVREVDYGCVAKDERNHEIVTVGRYDNNQKNHILLIRAFAIFAENHPDYTLKLYGEGDDRKLYQNLVDELKLGEKVEWVGHVDNPIQHICTADFFCLTSNFEGMPNALIEAMSIGLPCITTDFGGGAALELITDGYDGLIIPVDNEAALVKAMCKVADDRDNNQKLGLNAFKIRERLSVEKISDEWIHAVELILK